MKRYGFAVFRYDEAIPSIENYAIAETDNQSFDLDAVIDITPGLIQSDLDLATTKAERVSWVDRENNRNDAIILFTDEKGTRYYYCCGDMTYELHKA